MPEMQFVVRWPDETLMACYSPSLVIRDYFEVGASYALDDFVDRCNTALEIASDRVREKFGFPCSNAQAQLLEIRRAAKRFDAASGARVTIEAFDPPD